MESLTQRVCTSPPQTMAEVKTSPESRSFSVPYFESHAVDAQLGHICNTKKLTDDADCVIFWRVSCSSSRRVKTFHSPSTRAASARPCVLQIFQTCCSPFHGRKNETNNTTVCGAWSTFVLGQRLLIAIANLPLDHRFPASVNFRPVFADSDTRTEWVYSFCLSLGT